jgi:hypothetical protein
MCAGTPIAWCEIASSLLAPNLSALVSSGHRRTILSALLVFPFLAVRNSRDRFAHAAQFAATLLMLGAAALPRFCLLRNEVLQ